MAVDALILANLPGVALGLVEHVLVRLGEPVVVAEEVDVPEHVRDDQDVLKIGIRPAEESVGRLGIQHQLQDAKQLLILLHHELFVGAAPVPVDEPVGQSHAGHFRDLVTIREAEVDRVEGEAALAR